MDKKQAQKLIKETFEQPYDESRYKYFVKELFNKIDDSKEAVFNRPGAYVYDSKAFGNYIKSYRRLGKYDSPDGRKIDILAVNLKRETSLERARTAQRNFIAAYLKYGNNVHLRDAAIVAFYHDDTGQWRFSLVCMNYKQKEKDGRVKVEQELTPARRYSFLVGTGEPSHTAQRYLFDLLKDEKNNPTLSGLEEAFNVEKVSDEFFEKYRELFSELVEELEGLVKKDKKIAKEFSEKDVCTADFAKKLMGQLVFLYFIQKKGWLGVDKGGKWGTGPKDFLKNLFDACVSEGKNFFNDYLEPLFYQALASDRGINSYYDKLKCKIPFLNGGLFEPICGYGWENTDILISNDVFGKIFETFNLYNFTVKEDEPLDKEVAVDPEMLGKVFERLMEVKDRKSKGAYYTPREIVHYMCRESLINYLAAEMEGKVEKKDIENLIHKGDFAIENDTAKKEGSKAYTWDMPKAIRNNAVLIDEKLATIKICDPAIGSGAFPVGMMHEIVKARQALTPYMPDKTGRTAYDFKRHAIHESIYGVDIDPSAVDIAKLRLWLSLVVDEENYEEIKPLPNLDYKIMQGNSLLEEFEGVKLFDERILADDRESVKERRNEIKVKMAELEKQVFKAHAKGKAAEEERLKNGIKGLQKTLKKLEAPDSGKNQQPSLLEGESEAKKKAEELKQMQQRFFEEAHATEKSRLKDKIEKLIWELIEMSLKEQGRESVLKKVEQYKKSNSRPFFLWKLYFEDVFEEKGGFDVVIGNPPYVEHKKLKVISQILKKSYDNIYAGTADIYVYFYELAINILNIGGILSYITSNKFMKTSYGMKLRGRLSSQNIVKIIDFTELHVFDALVASCVSIIKKQKAKGFTMFVSMKDDYNVNIEISEYFQKHCFEVDLAEAKSDIWQLEKPEDLDIKVKIEKETLKLGQMQGVKIFRGITTGCNEAFLIDVNKKNMLEKKDKINKEIIKPLLQGRNIRKWIYKKSDKHIIFTKQGIDMKKYPVILEYLSEYKQNLIPGKGRKPGSYKWYEIQDNTAYYEEFEKEKIIWGLTADKWVFAFDNKRCYLPSNAYILTSENIEVKYLLALLNSKLMNYYFRFIGIMTAGNAYTLKHETIYELPIKDSTKEVKKEIVVYVNELLKKPQDMKKIEEKLNELVFQIYDLNSAEKEHIEICLNK